MEGKWRCCISYTRNLETRVCSLVPFRECYSMCTVCSGGWRMTNIVILHSRWMLGMRNGFQCYANRTLSIAPIVPVRVFVRGCSVFTARAYLCMCNSILHVCTRLTHYNGLNHWWLLTMDESSSEIYTIHACAGKYDRTFLSGAVAFIAPFKLANLRSFINNLHSVWLSNVSFLTKIELKFRMRSHGCLFYQRI